MTPRSERALLAGLLLAGAWLRLSDLDHIPFGDDAAHMLQYADRLRAGEAILTGIPSSKGVLNPPLAIYILAALRLALHSPQALAAATAVANLAGIVLTWWTARRYFGRSVALVSAALLAASCWAVFYSRAIWQQDFVPPLGALFLLCLLAWARERKPWPLAAALILAGASSQLHMTCFAWFAVIGAAWVLFRPPLKLAAVMAGIAGCAILYAPFLAAWILRGSLETHPGAPRTSALFREFDGRIVWYALASATHGGYSFQYPEIGARMLRPLGLFARGGLLLPVVIAGGLIVTGFVRSLRGLRETGLRVEAAPARVVALFAALPLAAMLGSGLATSPHYVIVLFPAPWILAAIGAEALASRGSRARIAAGAAVAVCVALEITFTASSQAWIRREPGHAGTDAPPLAEQMAAMRFIAADSQGTGVELVDGPFGHPVPDNYAWLLAEAGGRAGPGARYVIAYEGLPLSDAARRALEVHGAHRFGPLQVARWR